MKNPTLGKMAALSLAAMTVLQPHSASALGFTGVYDLSTWTTKTAGSGSVVKNAPNSVTLIGSNSGVERSLNTDFKRTFTENTSISYAWSYLTKDVNAAYDPAFYILNGVSTLLTNPRLGAAQSGTSSIFLPAGSVFGWRVNTADNLDGAGSLTISNFSFVGAPEIDGGKLPLAVMLLGLLFVISRRTRQGKLAA